MRWLIDIRGSARCVGRPAAAAVLALESFGLALFYGRRSVAIEATNPLVFAVPMFLAAVLVAWGRFGLAGLGAG